MQLIKQPICKESKGIQFPMFIYGCVGLAWTVCQGLAGLTLGPFLKVATWASIAHLAGLIACLTFGGIYGDWTGLGLGIAVMFFHSAWMVCAFIVVGSSLRCCNQYLPSDVHW
jgi:hypothetical protein